MTAILAFALEEYQRQHERATLAVARSPALRPRAEATCRAWLSIVLRLGGTHPHAAPWLDEVPIWPIAGVPTPGGRHGAEGDISTAGRTPPQADRINAAHTLAPLEQVHKALSHARDQAFAAALGHQQTPDCPEQSERSHRQVSPQAEQSKGAAARGHETIPPRTGEGDHPQDGGGVQAAQTSLTQSAQFRRFDTLKKLARRLGCFTPVALPAHPEPVAGPEPAPKLEQAA